MAPPTAQALTVVHALAGLVTDPTLRPSRVRPQVPLAEVRGLLKVDQIVRVCPPPVGGVAVAVAVAMGVLHLTRVSVVGFD